MIDDKTLLAWLDGELDPIMARRVTAAAEADPMVAARIERHRRLRALLREKFGALLDAPVPPALADAVDSRARVIDLAARRIAPRPHPDRWRRYGGLAAAVAVGLVGGLLLRAPPSGPVSDAMIASPELARALDTRLAASTDGTGPRILLSFAAHDGALCRSFEQQKAQGVACLRQGRWEVAGLFSRAPEAQGDYRMASAGDPRLMGMVDDMIAGAPFDAAQERRARDRGWTAR